MGDYMGFNPTTIKKTQNNYKTPKKQLIITTLTQSLKRKIWWGGSKFISYILLSLESLLFSQSECFQRGREDASALLCNCNTCYLAGRWGGADHGRRGPDPWYTCTHGLVE